MSALRVLSTADLGNLLPYAQLVPAVREAMIAASKGDAALPLRHAVELGAIGRVGVMAGRTGSLDLATVKVVAFPVQKGAESHGGVIIALAGEHLTPIAALPADAVTARRTAAASVVATQALAKSTVRSLAILGTGTQAAAHLQAFRECVGFDDLRIWGRDPDAADRLAIRHGGRAVETVAEAVAGADVVCTLNASAAPILHGGQLSPGTHVNMVGASFPHAREVDDEVIARGRLFVDFRASALAQAGELRGAHREQAIVAELGEVLSGGTGRRSTDEITLYKSLGIAAQDVAAVWLALDGAIARGLGVVAEL